VKEFYCVEFDGLRVHGMERCNEQCEACEGIDAFHDAISAGQKGDDATEEICGAPSVPVPAKHLAEWRASRVSEIEDAVAQGRLDRFQVFTKMRELLAATEGPGKPLATAKSCPEGVEAVEPWRDRLLWLMNSMDPVELEAVIGQACEYESEALKALDAAIRSDRVMNIWPLKKDAEK
jgi:hypothetical protein